MIAKKVKSKVERATVSLMGWGQAVVVSGGVMLTAAHCIPPRKMRGVVRDDYFEQPIVTTQEELIASPIMIDRKTDIAALAASSVDLTDAFKRFCAKTPPTELFTGEIASDEMFNIYVLTHKRTWTSGQGRFLGTG